MAISADILKNTFGFNDPNVINAILSDPNQTARYEKEYAGTQAGGGGTTTPATTTSILPSTADIIAKQTADEQALMDKYSGIISGQETLPAAYERLSTAANIPGLQSDIQKYKNDILGVQTLLDTLEENVNERTKGTLTTEAQRQRQIAAETAPLASSLGRLATGLQPLTEQLTTASGNVSTELGLESAQQTKELLPIQSQIATFSTIAANEITGYNADKKNELDLLTAKLKAQGDLSTAEYNRATDLLKIEAASKATSKQISDQLSADIKLKQTSAGSGGGNQYLAPAQSSPEGTVTTYGGHSWKMVGGQWYLVT